MRRLIAFVVFFLSFGLTGQEMLFNEANDQINLPSTECYKILQDSKGYIWIASELGLCRFDGKQTVIYNEKNGLPERSVYGITENSKGVWVCTSKSRILNIADGKITELKTDIPKLPLRFHHFTYNLQNAGEDKLLVNFTYNQSYFIDLKSGKLSGNAVTPKTDYLLIDNKEKFWLGGTSDQKVEKVNTPLIMKYVRNGKLLHRLEILPNQTVRRVPSQVLTASTKQSNYVVVWDKVYEFKKNGSYTVHQFNHRILDIFPDQKGNLWIGFLNNGLAFFKNGDLSSKPICSLGQYSVSDILLDREGSVWCTTLEKGIFKCTNPEIISYAAINGLNQRISLLTAYNNTLYASSSAKEIYAIDKHSIAVKTINSSYTNDRLSRLFFAKNGVYLCSGQFLLKTDKNFNQSKFITSSKAGILLQALGMTEHNGKIFITTSGSVTEIIGATGYIFKGRFPAQSRCIAALDNGKFLAGGHYGLKLVEIVNDSMRFAKDNLLPFKVDVIRKGRNGNFYIGTKDRGLFVYRNGKVHSLNKVLGITENVIMDVLEDSDGQIWLATNNGVLRLKFQKGKWVVERLSKENGLPDKEVFMLAAAGRNIYLSTAEGLIELPQNICIYNYQLPLIHLNNSAINGKPRDLLKNGNLSYDENNLKLSFDVISWKSKDLRISYKLNGRQNTIEGNEIILQSLEPGNYTLTVSAVNEYGLKSKPLIYKIKISPPFWRSNAFYIIIFLLICIAALGLVIYFRKRIEKKNRIAAMLAESKLTAVQSQMNPHFIFNSINSIQNYILKNKKEDAYDYLVKFSKLIRQVLNNSRETMLTVADELEILNRYVELEQIRFRNSFSFHVTVDEAIDEDEVMLPAMIIQPLLENAIWHGITPLKDIRHGELSLIFGVENGQLKITIRDNGVGRKVSADKDKAHDSLGMQLIRERLELVHNIYGKAVNMEITDCTDEAGNPTGTLIEILLPL